MKFLHWFALLCVFAFVPGIARADDEAERLFKAGEKAEKAGDRFHALLLYGRAAALDPGNIQYAMRKAALQSDETMFLRTTHSAEASSGAADSVALAPFTATEMIETREARMPPHLNAPSGVRSFNLKGAAKSIFEQVFKTWGLLVAFEGDYQSPPSFSFRLDDISFDETIHALEAASNSFIVPVNQRLALVVRDTPQKRLEMMPTMAIAIPIPERMSVQDAAEMISAVQQSLDIRKINYDPLRKVVFVRDQVNKIRAAQAMFANLSRPRAQVEVDIELRSIDKSSTRQWGIQLPTNFPLVDFGTKFQQTPYIPNGFTSFLTFGGGATFMGIGIASTMVTATMSKSDNDTLIKASLMAMDGQAATLHVGNRYPVITSQYVGTVPGGSNQQVYVPPPTINFEDLGLVLKITPSVHDEGEVTLDVESEFKVLGAYTAVGIPAISSRKFAGKVRVGFNESAVIAGLISTSETNSYSGVIGLSNIPVIGKLLRLNEHDLSSTDVLIVLKPRLTNLPAWESGGKPIWVGTETKPITSY